MTNKQSVTGSEKRLVDMKFKETSVRDHISDVVTNETKKKPNSPERMVFRSDIEVAGDNKRILSDALKNHKALTEYSYDLYRRNPQLTALELRDLVDAHIWKNKMVNWSPSCVEMLIHYVTSNKVNRVGATYMTFLEQETCNKNFTIGARRKSITFEGLDIVIRLKKTMPILPEGSRMYFNLGAIDVENLSDLHITVFYNKKQ